MQWRASGCSRAPGADLLAMQCAHADSMVISAKTCATGIVALVTWVSPVAAQVATPGRYQVVLAPRPDNTLSTEALLVDTVSGQTWVYTGGGSGIVPGWAPLRYIVPGP